MIRLNTFPYAKPRFLIRGSAVSFSKSNLEYDKQLVSKL